MIKKLIISDGVKRHLQQEHPVDIRNLEIEDQPSRQRRRFIKRQLMKKFKNENKTTTGAAGAGGSGTIEEK